MQTACIIKVDGVDVSSDLDSYLIKVSVTDKAGASSDTCSLELDDTDGKLFLPRDGVKIEILMGDGGGVKRIFSGTVDEVSSSGSRSGRTLSVSGKGVDSKGKAKEQKQKHWDNKTIDEVLIEAGEEAGLSSVTVAPALMNIKRPYIAMQNESFLHFAERIANEIGGTFKMQDGKAIVAERNGGKSASGQPLPSVRAEWGVNLISWDIKPSVGRPRYKETKTQTYDSKSATWKEYTVEIDDPDAKATYTDRYTFSSQEEAEQRAKSLAKDSENGKGEGTIVINGNADAQPEANINLVGARSGVDGTYRIEGVTHDYSRSGWTTSCEVKRPQGDAGKDKRKSKKKAGSQTKPEPGAAKSGPAYGWSGGGGGDGNTAGGLGPGGVGGSGDY